MNLRSGTTRRRLVLLPERGHSCPIPPGFETPHPGGMAENSPTFQRWVREFSGAQVPKGRLKPGAIRQPSSPPLNRYGLAFRIFRARPVPYGTTERPVVLQSQRDCVLQPRVAESARLPWEEGPVAVNPKGVAASGEARWSQPLWGRGLRTMFTQGSSRLATLGFETESLWDSSLEFPKGIGSNPSGIGPEVSPTFRPAQVWGRPPVCRFTESPTPCSSGRRNTGPETRLTGRPEVCPTLRPERLGEQRDENKGPRTWLR